ncbi:atrial natriuretic peptide receptor 1-like [Ciona intestinalis]
MIRFLITAIILNITTSQCKQINITIMVPGIVSFERLVADAMPLPDGVDPKDYYDVYSYESGPTSTPELEDHFPAEMNEIESGPGTTAATSYGYDSTAPMYGESDYMYNCVDENRVPDIKCLSHGHWLYPWSHMFAKPALEIALEKIKNTSGLLDGYEINLKYYDSGNRVGRASSRLSQIASVDAMMKDRMTVLIGPMDAYSMARVVSFTAHWDILTFTPGAISAGLRTPYEDEPTDNTMIRTGPVATQVGNCVAALLRHENWTTTAAEVFEDNLPERPYYFMAEGIYEGVVKDNKDFKMTQGRLSEFQLPNLEYDFKTAIRTLSKVGRILIITADDYIIRDFLKHAYEYKQKGDYAYIIIDLEDKLGPTPWRWRSLNGTMVEDEAVRKSCESALIVTLRKESSRKYSRFVRDLNERLMRSSGDTSMEANITEKTTQVLLEREMEKFGASDITELFQKNRYPAYFHDSLLMAAHLLNVSLTENTTNPTTAELPPEFNRACETAQEEPVFPKGLHLMDKFVLNKAFEGVSGDININDQGDRTFDFSVLSLDPNKGQFRPIGDYSAKYGAFYMRPGAKIYWPSGVAPRDVPKCGFDQKKCTKERLTLIEAIVILIVSIATVAVILSVNTYRRHSLKKELESQLWRVYWHDVTWPISPNSVLGGQLGGDMGLGEPPAESEPSLGEVISYYVPSLSPAIAAKRAHRRKRKWSSNSRKNERVCENERKTSAGSLISDKVWGGLTTLALYKDKTVVVKLTNRRKVELTRRVLMELKHMRDITHDHLTRFEGACVEWPHICVLTEYCRKGSLRDILLNEEIQLDWMFRVSLMNDLVKGMSFLHGSSIHSHGNLKSTNCVVDSRFVLKITDYGLGSFRSVPSYEESERQCEKKLWTAPELLRCTSLSPIGTQKGDVYSFGIILQEIALRKGTFYVGGIPLSCKEIVSKVRNGFRPYFRPVTDTSTLTEDLCSLMQRCWDEDPNERPDFNQTKKIIEKFNKDNPGNLVENLLHRMEQYAINLEGLVEERTAAYMEEKRKADDLLYQMLPVPVVDRLKRGDSVPAEAFESVTILFSDIVGFTSLSASSNPMQIVNLLNDLYTCFDAIIDNFDVYKVETIGDAYMLVSGLPVRNGIRHATEIARTALALLRAVGGFKIRHRPNEQLKLRIGIHTGPCCAGVVGLKMPRYCLFGDTVNTASRMESSGMPLAIHVSESTKALLERFQCFKLQLRGEVPLKGKGTVTTYWLLDETVYDEPSLDESESHV